VVVLTRVGSPFPVVGMADFVVSGVEGHEGKEDKILGKTSGSLEREERMRERLWVC